jgi:4-cresol dehydrogenase (hydroxylating)
MRKWAGDRLHTAVKPADRIQAGIPGQEMLQMARWYAQEPGHVGISPVTPLTGKDVVALAGIMRRMMERSGFDYIHGIVVGSRSAIHPCLIPYDLNDERQAEAAYSLTEALVGAIAEAGYTEYRSHLEFMDLVAHQFDFNNHALRRFNQTLKGAIDPNGIMAPGKQGIWAV